MKEVIRKMEITLEWEPELHWIRCGGVIVVIVRTLVMALENVMKEGWGLSWAH